MKVSVEVPDELVEQLEDTVNWRDGETRSDAIRRALREYTNGREEITA